MASSLFRTKSIDRLLAEGAATGEGTLSRTLGPGALIALGIGAIIGAGLFVRTAAAIADRAGPSVVLAFLVAGIGCAFAGLCYAEFASMIPIAGSAYTYSYATMGELVAWIIGWDLVLEYAVGAAFKVGDFDLKGGYLVGDRTGANNKFSQVNAGGTYTFGPSKVYLNLQQNKIETGAKGNVVAIAYSYALSKRTMVYTSYAKLDNNNLGVFGINSSSTNVTPVATAYGADPTAFAIGVRHSF